VNTQSPPDQKRGTGLARLRRIVGRVLLVLLAGALLLIGLRFGLIAWYDWQHAKEQRRIAAAVASLPAKDARMTLYSLDPMRSGKDSGDKEKLFHKYFILGQVEITDPDERTQLIALLAEDIRLKEGRWSIQCFDPRHGLRVSTSAGDCDFVICFACRKIQAHNFPADSHFDISGFARIKFNAALDRHGLERAPERSR
jgi:hypothetical protein